MPLSEKVSIFQFYQIYKGPSPLLRALRELTIKHKKEREEQLEGSEALTQQQDQEFFSLIRKLVDSTIWRVPQFPMSSVVDIFNQIGQKIAQWEELQHKEEFLQLLEVACHMASRTTLDVKVEESKSLQDIVLKCEDLNAVAFTLRILYELNLKKSTGKSLISLASFTELSERFLQLALGPNVLRDSSAHLSLIQISTNEGDIINSDLNITYKPEITNLNEAQSQKHETIPRQKIVDFQIQAQQVSEELAKELQKDQDDKFKKDLEARIIWSRYVTDQNKLRNAVRCQFQAFSLAFYNKPDGTGDFYTFLKDKFLKEAMEYIKKGNDQLLQIQLLSSMYKIVFKDNGHLVGYEKLITPEPPSDSDDEPKSFLIQVLEDIATVQITDINSITLHKQCAPKYLVSDVVSSSKFQFLSALLMLYVVKIITASQVRNSQVYAEFIKQAATLCLQILEQPPVKNVYCYNMLVQQQLGQVLRYILRPRMEEQLDIVAKIENRLLAEFAIFKEDAFYIDQEEDLSCELPHKDRAGMIKIFLHNLQELVSRDLNGVGIGRKIQEGKLLASLQDIIKLNNQETGHLIDPFITKYINMVGAICSDSAAQIPVLIKNGVIPDLLNSLEQRIPNSSDIFTSVIYCLSQVTIHQDGQRLLEQSALFKKLFDACIDENIPKSPQDLLYSETSSQRSQLSCFFDRNPQYKEIARQIVLEQVAKLKIQCLGFTKQYYMIIRSLKNTEEASKQFSTIKQRPEYSRCVQSLALLNVLSFLSNDRSHVVSRHSVDIFKNEVFTEIMGLFELISETSLTQSLSTMLQKSIKNLVDHAQFLNNNQLFVNKFKESIKKLQDQLGPDFNKCHPISHLMKEDQVRNLRTIDEYDPSQPSATLSKEEETSQLINIVNAYAKTFLQTPSQTKQITIAQYDLTNEIKLMSQLMKLIQHEQTQLVVESIKQLEQSAETEQQKTQKEALFGKADQLTKEQGREVKKTARQFFYEQGEDLLAKKFNFNYKDLQLNDFLNKIWQYSSLQRQIGGARENQKKNLSILGQLIFQSAKDLKFKQKLSPESLKTFDLLHHLQVVNSSLGDLQYLLNKGWLEGVPFYEFYRLGGLHKLIQVFRWLKDLSALPKSDWQYQHLFLYDETCLKIKDILTSVFTLRQIDNQQQSFLDINMSPQFSSTKVFFANMFNTLCTGMLPINNPAANPLTELGNDKNEYLQEIIVQLLTQASKGFSQCIYLRENVQNQQRNRNARNQPDPNSVQYLVSMGFPENRAIQALNQYPNIERATEYLLTSAFDLPENDEAQNILSSGDSDQEDQQMNAESSSKNVVVTFEQYQDNLKKVQVQGFKWVLEAQIQDKMNRQKSRDFLVNTMLGEKDDKVKKDLFQSIFGYFKDQVLEFTKSAKIDSQEDQIMTDSQSPDTIKSIETLNYKLELLQKLIVKDKRYLKESIRAGLYTYCLNALNTILDKLQKQPDIEESEVKSVQVVVMNLMLVIFSLLSFIQIWSNIYEQERKKQPADNKKIHEEYDRKLKEFTLINEHQQVFDSALKLLTLYKQQTEQSLKFQFKPQNVTMALTLLLKALSNEKIRHSNNGQLTRDAFETIRSIKTTGGLDSKLFGSLVLYGLDDLSVNEQLTEKLIQRGLYLKGEDQLKKNKLVNKELQGPENELTQVKSSNFLSYFSALREKDSEMFNRVTSKHCQLKAKKRQDKVVQETALIKLTEKTYQDLKKLIAKERQTLKVNTKVIDVKSDKNVRKELKQSRQVLQQSLSAESISLVNTILQILQEGTSAKTNHINDFLELQSQNHPYLLSKEDTQKSDLRLVDDAKTLELLSKVSLAYPAVTAQISFSTPKKSFPSWFIQDYLPNKLFNKTTKQKDDQTEVKYDLIQDLTSLQESVFTILNNFTSYNHLMNVNEQLVKSNLRLKFVLESLTILQKSFKKGQQTTFKQKIAALSCLIVIDSLINFENPVCDKNAAYLKENFYNSIRAAIFREGMQSSFVHSLIKTLSDLFSEVTDVSNKCNGFVIQKAVQILRILSDFITLKKKQQKRKLREEEKKEGEEVKMEVIHESSENIDMQHVEQEEEQALEPIVGGDQQDDDADEGEDHNEEESLEEDEEGDEDMEDMGGDEDEEDLVEEEEEDEEAQIELMQWEDIEEDFDSDEEVFLDQRLNDLQARGAQMDIVNVNINDIMRMNNNNNPVQPRRYFGLGDPRGGALPVRAAPGDWSQEEQEVQRLLLNFRGLTTQYIGQANRGENLGSRQNQQASIKLNLVEQMFEGLKQLQEKDLFEIALKQKQELEQEYEVKVDIDIDGNLNLPALRRQDLGPAFLHNQVVRVEVLEELRRLEEGHPIQRLEGLQLLLGDQLGFGDPMYIRPPVADRQAAQQQQQQILQIGDVQMLQTLMRRQQQNQAAENVGEQLFQAMNLEEVQEEVKKEESKHERRASTQLRDHVDDSSSLEANRENLFQNINAGRDQINRQQEELLRQHQRFMEQQDINEQAQQDDQAQLLEMQNLVNMLFAPPRGQQAQQEPPSEIQQVQQQPQPSLEEQKQDIAEENKAEEIQQQPAQEEVKQEENKQEPQPEAQAQESSGKTFGYDNDFLLAHDIDPAILAELPEELRVELLSTLEVPAQTEEQKNDQPSNASNEERKENVEQQQQQQQQNPGQNDYTQLAAELGIDPEFLQNIPEEFRNELIQNEQLRNRNMGVEQAQPAQPRREAEQMDLASFIATVNDPRLRMEIFANMDEATMATLPPHLMAEARNNRMNMRYGGRPRDNFGGRMHEQFDALHARHDWGLFGGRAPRQPNAPEERDTTLEQSITIRQRDLSEELDCEDCVSSIVHQLGNDERITEAFIQLLCNTNSVECELIPCISQLMKIQATNGYYIIRNKFLNVLTYLLKLCVDQDESQLKAFLQNQNIKPRTVALIIIGSLRVLLKSNKKTIKHILKSLLSKDDYFKVQGSHVLKKQQKAVSSTESKILPPLTEILTLVKNEKFKNDKVLMKNISLLIQQILKQFGTVVEELGVLSNEITQDSVESFAEILSLEFIDQQLMLDLGEFLYQISRRKKQNYDLISGFCQNKCENVLEKINTRLDSVSVQFESVKRLSRLSPSKSSQMEIGYSPSQDSIIEEEKSEEMIIDTSAAQEVKQGTVKLTPEETKILKSSLKMQEESEVVLRIFKLFNLFCEKFSKQQSEEEKAASLEGPENALIVKQIEDFYGSKKVSDFIHEMNDVLRIISNANIEINESMSNLIFSVFASFFPEVYLQMSNADQLALEDKDKRQVRMTNIEDSLKHQKNVEKFALFRNIGLQTQRTQELSNFCFRNKRIINKLIKQKTSQFMYEMEGLIKYMPNLLDFDNKIAFFKQELQKMKRRQQWDSINLYIRRDDIFMDAYAQLGGSTANEMKGRLHISFTGERGQDAGGLTREFYVELSREMFNPMYSLFNLSSNGSTYYPNPRSYVEKDHLRYFKFIGRIIGKALLDECLLECYFVRSLYKIMIGENLNYYDLEDFDNEFFNNLKWCLENDVEPLQQTFSTIQDFFGRQEEIELIPEGKKIIVTNENKKQYVEKLCLYKLYTSIQQQIDAFLEGFYELIPRELVSMFNWKELELLISGLPNFDINDLKQNTEFQGYNANSPQILWLWEILESFDQSERAEFLQFVTGSSKVPLDGFKGLIGMRGPQRFQVAKIKTEDTNRLPSGHTCFNQLDLPEYPSKEIMHERLLTAIKETKGFGFA